MYNLYVQAPVLPIRLTVVSSWRSVKCMEVVAKNDGEKEEKSQMIERKTEICKRKKIQGKGETTKYCHQNVKRSSYIECLINLKTSLYNSLNFYCNIVYSYLLIITWGA